MAPAQRSFAGGELSPACYARTDLVKYATGLRQCRNFIVQRHGGAANRPGTQFIASAKNSAVTCRLLKFVLDSTDIADTYLIEAGEGYFRFYQHGAAVVVSGVAAWVNATAYAVGDLVTDAGATYYCTVAHTASASTNEPGAGSAWAGVWYALEGGIYEIPTPYATDELGSIRTSQSGDIVTLVHPAHAPMELRRYGSTRWTLAAIAFGPAIATPTNVLASGGAAGASTYYAVTAVATGTQEESLPGLYTLASAAPASGSPVSLSWDQMQGAGAYNVYRSTDGKTYGLIAGSGGQATPQTDSSWTSTSASVTSNVPGTWVAASGSMGNTLGSISATRRAFDGNYTVRVTARLTSGAASDRATRARFGLYYQRNTDSAPIFSGYAVPMDPVVGPDGDSGAVVVSMTLAVPDNGYTTLNITVAPEINASTGGSNCTLVIDNSVSSDVSWMENSTAFEDAGGDPDFSQAPPVEQALFGAVSKFPAAVGVYQQRRMLGNTSEQPETVWGSRIGSPSNFAISTPILDSDSVSFGLAGKQVNVVKHLLDLARLLVFTTGSVLAVDGDQAGTLTPSAINPRRVARQGIGRLPPLEVNDSAVYVQARGSIVRSLTPVEAGGAFGGYTGSNLSIFANHLFDGYTIADWDYAEEPLGVVWCARSDGTLLGLTFLAEQQVWGWHRHDTDGAVENVCVIPEGAEDRVYLVVRRTVNGATVRYLERMASRFFTDVRDAWFVDAGLSYDGWRTDASTVTLSGGTAWDNTDTLSCTASTNTFASTNVGDAVFVLGADGYFVRCFITAYTDATHVSVKPDRAVPPGMQGVAIGNGAGTWALAVAKVGGLDHLEGKALAIVGDGFVVASPNNPGVTAITVTGGVATLPAAYAQIIAGLPYISDLETLDLDSAGPSTTKDRKKLVAKVGLNVLDSRGIWAGQADTPTAANPVFGLEELKGRSDEDYDSPPALHTDYVELNVAGSWNTNGRFLVRQVDPLPLTILSASPIGYGS